jgi:type I restriction enzyme, S subunit
MEVKPGYKQTEVGVIPDEWDVVSVQKLVDENILKKPLDGNHGNIHPKSSDYVDHGIPFVMANNFANGEVNLGSCKFITKARADRLQKGFSVAGDVLLTHKGTVGNTAIVGELSTDYIMLTPQVTYYRVTDHNRLSNRFLRQYFDSQPFQSLFISLAGGGTRAYLGIVKQLALPIVKPPVIEQRAIAEALSDVDGLLRGLDRLITKKRDLKQAAMQQLLTGQTRLPGFHGRWEVKRIGEFAGCTAGGTPSTSVPSYWGGSIRWMSSGELNLKRVEEVAGRITWEGLHNSSTQMIPPKCVLIGLAGQGKTRGTVAMNFVELCTNQSIAAILPSAAFVPEYLYYHLDTRYDELRDLSSGDGGRGGLNLTIIKGIRVPLPSIPEQTAIAKVLTDMDAELAALEQRREKTRALKQAMMQELLTGRTRLV